ncbi:MAG: hypothetical protein JKY30_12630 [Flavobacteriales bacterium]|nr:hypothetical protein [Flavobacteriales bacterium]
MNKIIIGSLFTAVLIIASVSTTKAQSGTTKTPIKTDIKVKQTVKVTTAKKTANKTTIKNNKVKPVGKAISVPAKLTRISEPKTVQKVAVKAKKK